MAAKKNRVTIADVAKYARVSTMTVSRVANNRGQVSEATTRHVLHAMNELGYRPNRVARSLVSNQTLRIGVIVPDLTSIFFSHFLESAEHTFWEHNYQMLLCNTGNNDRREQDVLNLFEEDRVDGVLILGSHLSYDQLSCFLRRQQAAVVFNTRVDSSVASQIIVDESWNMGLAVQHLLDTGRSNIGFIAKKPRTYSQRERRRAFLAYFDGVETASCWQMMAPRDEDNDEAIQRHIEQHPTTDGLICFNDDMAACALRVCRNMGLSVPDDIGVIGIDDIEISRLVTPRLTTLRLTITQAELGKLAAQTLLDRIAGKFRENPIILKHELVIREST